MNEVLNRLAYAALTAIAAVLLLAGSSLAVQHVRAQDRRVADADRRLTLDYLAYNRRNRSHVFRAVNVRPGQGEDRLLVVGNDGRRYVRRIALTQDRVTNTGFGGALQLQLWDRTTNRCIYPAPLPRDPEFGHCRRWGAWDARSELSGRRIVPISTRHWRPGERHVIKVRYRLADWSPNRDQGQEAGFRFVWRYHG